VYGLMQPVMEPVFPTMGVTAKAGAGMPGTWSEAPTATVGVATGDVLLRTAQKVGGAFAKFTAPTFQDYLKTAWQGLASQHGGAGDFDAFWRSALARGGVYSTPPAAAAPALAAGLTTLSYTRPTLDGDGAFVFVPYAHSLLYDGRGANRPWLLENPDPVTKVTWNSWVEVSPAML
jgi:molybdopterin-containing oxidoreductase family iron-sulfur binding subunit